MKLINAIVILIIILFNTTQCYSTDNILNKLLFLKQIILPTDLYHTNQYNVKINGERIYIANVCQHHKISNDSILIFMIDTFKTIKYRVLLPTLDVMYDFTINKSSIYIMTQFSIFKFNINNNIPKLSHQIQIDKPYSKISLDNDKIILLSDCWSCSFPGRRSLILDTNLAIKEEINFKEPIGFQMSYFGPNRRLGYYNSKFIIADIIDYQIKIKNYDSKKEFVIERSNSIFNNDPLVRISFGITDYDTWMNVNKYNEVLRCSIGRIEFADFVNDTVIMVCYTKSDKNCSSSDKYLYDIWIYDNIQQNWILKDNDMYFQKPAALDYPKSLGDIGGGIYINYDISSGYLLCKKFVPFDINNSDLLKLPFEKILEKINSYPKENPPKFSLFIYSLDLK